MTVVPIPTRLMARFAEHEHFIQVIDQFITGMADGLSRLENQPCTDIQKRDFLFQKDRIVENMEFLDSLVRSFRTSNVSNVLKK